MKTALIIAQLNQPLFPDWIFMFVGILFMILVVGFHVWFRMKDARAEKERKSSEAALRRIQE